MKYIDAISVFILFATSAIAQKDVKWTEPQPHTCFYGLKISVLNMGYQEAPKAYLWGIRITNNYRKAVTFRYRLVVGNESMSGTGTAWKLKPGANWTDGGDVFTGNMFQSPSANWKLTVSQVCFDGENCGGPNECYAECDRIQGNEYQPCDGKYDPSKNQQSADVTGTAQAPEDQKADKGYSGAFTEWQQEGKDVKLTISQNENGIYWRKKEGEPPVLFKNIRQGTYRYEAGGDFFIIRFESDNRLSFWNNGTLLGYFTKPKEKKNETVKKEPSKPADNSNVTVDENTKQVLGKWRRVDSYTFNKWYNANITNTGNGLEIEFYDHNKIPLQGKSIFKRTNITVIPENVYKMYDDKVIAQWEGIIHFPTIVTTPNAGEVTNRKCVLLLLGVPGKQNLDNILLGSIENGKFYALANLLRDSNILGPSAGNESTTIEGEYWPSGTAFIPGVVKKTNGGISISYPNLTNVSYWSRISNLEYQGQFDQTIRLKFINSNTFRMGNATYSKASLWSKTEKWINNNPANTNDYLMLYIDNEGLHEMYPSLSYFAQKVGTGIYRRSENPDYPNYRAVIYKITSPTTLTIEYTDTNGQVNLTKSFTKASK